MIHVYQSIMKGITYSYGLMSLVFIINAVAFMNYKMRFIQFLLCQLAVLKIVFCVIVLAQWDQCPWFEARESYQSDNFVRSFKITLSTLYQTFFCVSLLIMVMGFKITKERLNLTEIRRVLSVAVTQYFVDSLYSILGNIPYFGKFTSTLINAFSVAMIIIIVKEARMNFDLLNLRHFIVG
jgi:hypothetical protein